MPRHWARCCSCKRRVRDYVAVLGLELVLDEAEGYAFLRSRPEPDDDDAAPRLPRLVARRPLSFPVSLLLALLRKKLAEFDAGGGDTRLMLSRDEVVELVRVFLPEGSNEARLIDQVGHPAQQGRRAGLSAPLKPARARAHAAGRVRGAAHPQGLCRRAVAGRVRCAAGGVPGAAAAATGRRRQMHDVSRNAGLDFVADDSLSGFRLQRLEVLQLGHLRRPRLDAAAATAATAADRRHRLGQIDPGGCRDHAAGAGPARGLQQGRRRRQPGAHAALLRAGPLQVRAQRGQRQRPSRWRCATPTAIRSSWACSTTPATTRR